MTKLQLKRFLKVHGLSQAAAARALDLAPRTVRRYVKGALPVPQVVEMALRYFIEQREKGVKS
jgi:plasmid maintenance system antidote protein VapI